MNRGSHVKESDSIKMNDRLYSGDEASASQTTIFLSGV